MCEFDRTNHILTTAGIDFARVSHYDGSRSLWSFSLTVTFLFSASRIFRPSALSHFCNFRPFRISVTSETFRLRFSDFSCSVFRSGFMSGCFVFSLSDCSVFGASANNPPLSAAQE
jgi:hypothetical protein